jgi:hypothetical protein
MAYRVGDIVIHPHRPEWGLGVIERVDPEPAMDFSWWDGETAADKPEVRPILQVHFDKAGRKQFDLSKVDFDLQQFEDSAEQFSGTFRCDNPPLHAENTKDEPEATPFDNLNETMAADDIDSITVSLDFYNLDVGEITELRTDPAKNCSEETQRRFDEFAELTRDFVISQKIGECKFTGTYKFGSNIVDCVHSWIEHNRRECCRSVWQYEQLREAITQEVKSSGAEWNQYWFAYARPNAGHRLSGALLFDREDNNTFKVQLAHVSTRDAGGYVYENDSISQSQRDDLAKLYAHIVNSVIVPSPQANESLSGTFIVDYEKCELGCAISYNGRTPMVQTYQVALNDFLESSASNAPDAEDFADSEY